MRPLVVVVAAAALATFAAFVDAARIEASAKLTTCLVAFENWSNAANVAKAATTTTKGRKAA